MADKTLKVPGNVPGAYYVDDTCIDCDQCRNMAPTVFGRDVARGSSTVRHQPETPEELASAEEARTICPSESIGNDREE